MKKLLKKVFRFVLTVILTAALTVVALNGFVMISASRYIVSEEEFQGSFDYVMVLGCGYYDANTPSPLLRDRLDKGIEVFEGSDSKWLLMTGDSKNRRYHDETGLMSRYAQGKGIDETLIVEDPYGLRTYDSIWRAANVYGAKKMIIVTSAYHLYRAVYLARALGIEAVGVKSYTRFYASTIWWNLREAAARCKDFIWALTKPLPTYSQGKGE